MKGNMRGKATNSKKDNTPPHLPPLPPLPEGEPGRKPGKPRGRDKEQSIPGMGDIQGKNMKMASELSWSEFCKESSGECLEGNKM